VEDVALGVDQGCVDAVFTDPVKLPGTDGDRNGEAVKSVVHIGPDAVTGEAGTVENVIAQVTGADDASEVNALLDRSFSRGGFTPVTRVHVESARSDHCNKNGFLYIFDFFGLKCGRNALLSLCGVLAG
jgi:hypothetical protein